MFRGKKKLLMFAALLAGGFWLYKKQQQAAAASLTAAAPTGTLLHGLRPTVRPNTTTNQRSNVVLNSWRR